jgi:hypothetical protein
MSAWTFIAQYLNGNSAVGPTADFDQQYYMTYSTAFVLTSLEWKRERLTARFDDFRTHQLSGFNGPPSNDLGHAWTIGWQHELGRDWQFAAEWIRVTSRFPPRVEYGEPAELIESQLQFAVRYRFHLAV